MLKLGLMLGYAGKQITVPIELLQRAEHLGFHSAWVSEAYGSDAVSVASWILAQTRQLKVGTCIMQMPARTPAMTAMTAMTLDQLSGGRFILGLGASGPQVSEGWHGMVYNKPVTRTHEYIDIIRKILKRDAPLEHDSELYPLPNRGPGTTGLGRPLKSILQGNPDLPIYTAAITPAGLRCAGEVADGVFPIWLSPEKFSVLQPHLEEGFGRVAGGKTLANFDVAPVVSVIIGDDLDRCRQPVKQFLALYIGGMGARDKNFYAGYAAAMGYGEAATRIQDHYLKGDKVAAVAAVPDELVDEIALVGPADHIKKRAKAWIEAHQRKEVGTLLASIEQPQAIELLAELFLGR